MRNLLDIFQLIQQAVHNLKIDLIVFITL